MIKIEESTGNAYADLGMADADEMLVKAQLATKIGEIIKSRKWSQQQAAEDLGMTQPKLSKMLRGQFRGISSLLKNRLCAVQGRAAIFQTRCRCLKNEAKRKSHFSLCVLKKPMDGLFQQTVSEAKMPGCLTRLGRDVQIVGPARRAASAGHVAVVFAV